MKRVQEFYKETVTDEWNIGDYFLTWDKVDAILRTEGYWDELTRDNLYRVWDIDRLQGKDYKLIYYVRGKRYYIKPMDVWKVFLSRINKPM